MYSRMFGNGKAEMLIPLLRKLAEKSSQPVAVHLDHGASLEQVKDAIRWGCTSVMFDGSNLPMEENIRITAEVVKLAKRAGVSTEAEIGHVAMGDEGHLTDPGEAKHFVEATGVDALAVAIGTAHGYYKSPRSSTLSAARRLPRLCRRRRSFSTAAAAHRWKT